MNAVWMVARSRLRRRRASTVVVAVLVGLGGGVVLAAVAGASRTDTAMERFLAHTRPEDVYVTVNGPAGDPSNPEVVAEALASRERLVGLPQVAEVARSPYLFLSPDPSGEEAGAINPFAAADDHVFRTVDRPLVLAGRMARVDRPDEAVVDDGTARLRHLRVGSRVTLWSFTADQQTNAMAGGFGKLPAPEGPTYTFRIVGIVRQPQDVNAPPLAITRDARYTSQGAMQLTPAFLHRYTSDLGLPEEALPGMEGFRVRLRHGLRDLPGLREGLRGTVRAEDIHVGSDAQAAADRAERAMHLEAIALIAFAGVTAVAALLIVGQAVGGQVMADGSDNATLAALGFGRRELVVVPLVRAGVAAVIGGAIAVVVAVALSPLTPIGLARRAEIHPGVTVNVAILAVGFGAVVVAMVLRALASAWRLTAGRGETAPPSAAPASATAGLSVLGPTAVAGAGLSFERRRRVPFGRALVAALVAVSGVVGGITFGASLHHLVATPSEQGWTWDVLVGNPNTQAFAGDPIADPLHARMVSSLAENRYVAAFSGVALADGVTINGHAVATAGVETIEGSVYPPFIEGRPPVADEEIALARDDLDRLHLRVGQTAPVTAGTQTLDMRVVGVPLQPTAADLGNRLSRGALLTVGGLRRLLPDTPVLQFAVRYRRGVDRAAATRSLVDDIGREVLRPYPGGEVGNLAKVDFLPAVLAGVLVALAVSALGLTLVASVRRHRRDLAVLKTIGFVRRQVWAAVAWQATALAAAALVVGIPVGLVAGRWAWRLVAGSLGSVSPTIVPIAVVLVVLPVTVVVANLLAAIPARAASGVRPAEALRAE